MAHLEKRGASPGVATLHEQRAGRLVIDSKQAEVEFGEDVASGLKLSADGTKVLWPQPTDSPLDPQTWIPRRKALQLFIITLASVVPAFDSGIGVTAIFSLADQYDTSTDIINDLTTSFETGWGGVLVVVPIRRWGRLPILFWSQVLAMLLLVGATLAPNLKTFAVAPQTIGLYIVTDMYPFHLQAQKLNIWTCGYILSPFLSPFVFGFLVARTTWRWAYGAGAIYGGLVCVLVLFFGEETMYDRGLKPVSPAKHRDSWYNTIMSPIRLAWRPQLLGLLFFEITNAIFLGSPLLLDSAFCHLALQECMALRSWIATFVGEVIVRYTNDWLINVSVRRNSGVFQPEGRLWACYISVPLYICGFVVLGAALQKHLGVGALVMGWGIAQCATVAVLAYGSDSFPKHHGEVSAFFNFARVIGGFSVAYFQVPWALKHGALQVFGVEAAIVCGLFLLVIPLLQLKGGMLRVG
ncbi:MFS general substrate transporter [Mycena sp. CBHHK59/15]|nr:MFS general substrate transporter [Mycena sp. CBHHK59/15]